VSALHPSVLRYQGAKAHDSKNERSNVPVPI
jgi:hypothetical protein